MVARKRAVRSHTRNGHPVRGYVAHRTVSEKIGGILRGDEKGNFKLVAFGAGLLGVGTALWYTASFAMTGAEAAIFTVSAISGVLGIGAVASHRRKHPMRHKQHAVIFSPRKRMHLLQARIRKAAPRNKYRRFVQNYRKRHPIRTGLYDRWFGKFEVTAVTGKGKSRKAETTVVRGAVNRTTFIEQAKERSRQMKEKNPNAPTWEYTSRQMFR